MNIQLSSIQDTSSNSLHTFLANHEPITTFISEKILHKHRQWNIKDGHIYYIPKRAAVYHGATGVIYPAGISAVQHSKAVQQVIGSFTPHTIMGSAADVRAADKMLSQQALHTVQCALMKLAVPEYPPCVLPPFPGLQIAVPQKALPLLPLQLAYETEEVYLPHQKPSVHACLLRIKQSIAQQYVLTATYKEKIIAKAGTNAQGYNTAQIGGRLHKTRMAWAGNRQWLITHLLFLLAKERKNASLFVRNSNTAAHALYRNLGFQFESFFQINY